MSFNLPPLGDYSFEGDCCGDTASTTALFEELGAVPMAVVHGTPAGTCCKQQLGVAPTAPQPLFSASKWITGMLFLRLVEVGKLASLDVKVADVLSWWSKDGRGKDVTVRHLLLQTDGMKTYEAGLGACEAATTVECAKEAYRTAFPEDSAAWTYSETSFNVLGAVAMHLTGAATYDQVFQELILPKVPAVNASTCFWGYPSKEKADPGASLICSAEEYAAILLALAQGRLLSAASERELMTSNTKALQDDSLFGVPVPGLAFKYGLGHWQEMNAASGALEVMSSLGYAGCYPWMTADKSRWGVAVRVDPITSPADFAKVVAVLAHFGHGAPADAVRIAAR